jgi:hypothetical protein
MEKRFEIWYTPSPITSVRVFAGTEAQVIKDFNAHKYANYPGYRISNTAGHYYEIQGDTLERI